MPPLQGRFGGVPVLGALVSGAPVGIGILPAGIIPAEMVIPRRPASHRRGRAWPGPRARRDMYPGDLVEFGPTAELSMKPKQKDTADCITGRFG
jgi:hypothetical protein